MTDEPDVYADVPQKVVTIGARPLHVRVAEALGWFAVVDATAMRDGWYAARRDDDPKMLVPVPRYDTEWAASGPLIEKYGISVVAVEEQWGAFRQRDAFFDYTGAVAWLDHEQTIPNQPSVLGPTPLIAVCNLILALKAAGKLEP